MVNLKAKSIWKRYAFCGGISMEHYAVSTKKHKWYHALVAIQSRGAMIGHSYII